MTQFYTSIYEYNNQIFHEFVKNGEKKLEIVNFKPKLGVKTNQKTGFMDPFGNNIMLNECDSIDDFQRKRKEKNYYNDISPIFQFIGETYPEEIKEIDIKHFKIFNFDIEIYSRNGYAEWSLNENPAYPISAISVQLYNEKKVFCFGYKEIDESKIDLNFDYTYIHCKDEAEILTNFITLWREYKPDIISGWNCDAFDIPYICRRILKVLPDAQFYLNKLSRVGKTYVPKTGKRIKINGVESLDYMLIYKNFEKDTRESYSLDFISNFELGEGKVSYEEVDDLGTLHDENYSKYIGYSLQDSNLIGLIEDKKQYIRASINMCSKMKCLWSDALGTVRKWDTYIYNELLKTNTVIIPRTSSVKQGYPGGYVGEPELGFHNWRIVYDIASSYPNQIRVLNISPETLVHKEDLPIELHEFYEKFSFKYSEEGKPIPSPLIYDDNEWKKVMPLLNKYDLILAPNGRFFRKDHQGFLAKLVENDFLERKIVKKEMKGVWSEIETLRDEMKKRGISIGGK